ncbi:MAG TPA: hypothetical protein PK619_00075 [bacterium]|nr:hypothetical protein [bacterium]HPN81404.1 hypothetical protein [bacterium]HPW39108.1 hypothetical protein [bacterium]
MKTNQGLQKIEDILTAKINKRPPAYEWQDLALRVIGELNIPSFKRAAVFKVCKDNPKQTILKTLNDTKELCESGPRWKYFFKILSKDKLSRS